jgi:hypothetical protein
LVQLLDDLGQGTTASRTVKALHNEIDVGSAGEAATIAASGDDLEHLGRARAFCTHTYQLSH